MRARSRQEIATLEVALMEHLTAEELKPLAALAGTKLPTRKAELARVVADLLAGAGLRRTFERLDELQQAAVADVVHSTSTRFSSARFRARYGKDPGWGGSGGYAREAGPTLLRLFFYVLSGDFVMPNDLKERLRDFVPVPAPATVRSFEQLPELAGGQRSARNVVRSAEPAAGRALASVLRLVDTGKLVVSDKTRRPAARSIAAITSLLEGGDFYASEPCEGEADEERAGPIRAFAWPMIVQAGGLVELAGTRLQLTKAGRRALAEPASATLLQLWKRWLTTTSFDELARIDCVKGQNGKGRQALTGVASRRSAIVSALATCPPRRWIAADDLLRHAWATGNDFAVSRNPWLLYVDHPEYGSLGYDSTGLVLEQRYLLCLLFEYAATLGMLDVAFVAPAGARADYGRMWGTDDLPYFSRYDGLMFVRITQLGAQALGIEQAQQPARTEAEPVLRVLADLEVVATGELERADRLALDAVALPVSDLVWRLDQGKILEVTEQGWSVEEIRDFLTARCEGGLPGTVTRLLEDVAARDGRVRDRGLARLVECEDRALAALVSRDRRTGRHCIAAGERHVVVPAASDAAFRRGLRELGYLLATSEGGVSEDRVSKPRRLVRAAAAPFD